MKERERNGNVAFWVPFSKTECQCLCGDKASSDTVTQPPESFQAGRNFVIYVWLMAGLLT